MLKIGSHVGMNGSKMFLGSVEEALSYGENTFMIYTGAPQNTRRKKIEELNIPLAHKRMEEAGIQKEDVIVHAPYIINLANTVKPETYQLAEEFLAVELERTAAMGSNVLVLHPGSHVGAGTEAGTRQIIHGLNQVLTNDTPVYIALETMAGKGSEIGSSFEEIAAIYDGVNHPEKLRVCFDTCHVHDAGYDIINEYDKVLSKFDELIGLDQIAVFHVNDSKNPVSSHKDRHENFGFGYLGFDALYQVITDTRFSSIPKILETPYVPLPGETKKTIPPYRYEIAMIRSGQFEPDLKEKIINSNS